MLKIRRLLALCLAVFITGCYSYSTVPFRSAPAGERVRVRISASQAADLEEVLPRQDRVLEGRVVSASGGSIMLEVPSTVASAKSTMYGLNQRITLSDSEVLELEVRELDRWKTAGVIGLVAAGATFVAVQAFATSEVQTPNGGEGGDADAVVIPLVKWSW
ncbi:MAG TPA: hypothetical protein VFI91_11650 [Longimicrobiaceae bacterium]|nr:hypothetical protein [Longimicrobiaceae bacterium]